MGLLQGACFCVLVVVLCDVCGTSWAKPLKSDKCEYDLDLEENNIRVVCQGKNANVNIYATNAEMGDAALIPEVKTKKTMKPQRDSAQTKGSLMDFRHVSPMSETVWNATKKMERLKRKLSRHSNAMTNITQLLATGDRDLRSDLDNMRRMQYLSVTLKDAMLASIQNQYNFMRTAILTQNAELTKMMDSLTSLIDVTSRSLQSAARSEVELFSQIGVVNQTMVTMRRMLSRELKKKRRGPNIRHQRNKGKCPRQILAVGLGDTIDVKAKRGTFMKDAADDTGTVYVMQGAGNSDKLVEYESEIDLEYAYSIMTFNLPFKCHGTGHVIYRGCLFCQMEGSLKIIKYKLSRMEKLGEIDLLTTGLDKIYSYNQADGDNIDLAVDELGLWAIFTTPESAGKIMISKINDDTMEIENTWMTSFPQSLAGNTFMICGVLYVVGPFSESPTFVKYKFDTSNARDTIFREGTLVFPALEASSDINLVMMDYNHNDGELYAWGGGKVFSFHMFLE